MGNADFSGDLGPVTITGPVTIDPANLALEATQQAGNTILEDIDGDIGDPTDPEAAGNGSLIAIAKRIRTLAGSLALDATVVANGVILEDIDGDIETVNASILAGNAILEDIDGDIGDPTDPEAAGNGSVIGILKRLRTLLGNVITNTDPTQIVDSVVNTTTAPLAAGAAFTPIVAPLYDDLTNYQSATINFFAAPPTATGTLIFEFSRDGVTWPVSVQIFVADPTVFVPFPLRAIRKKFRVRYLNNPTIAQTAVDLNVVLHRQASEDLTRTQTQVIGPAEPVKVARSLIESSVLGDRSILGADRSIFGDAITASRVNRIELNPTLALANNRLTTTVANGGTVTQEPTFAEFRLSTGANVNGSARLQSVVTDTYKPGREKYLIVPVRFTLPTSAASFQRAGLLNAARTDGFFLGYEGLVFGFTVRKNGSADAFVALTAANGDPLDATFLSRFARGNVLERLVTTNKNVWRIRVGLLGSSLQFFDLQSPDGTWMRIQANRFPNLQTGASILDWNLGFYAEASKTASDATNLVVGVGSVDAGWVGDPYGLEPFEVHGREEVHANALLTGGAAATGVLVYTVNAGRKFRLTDIPSLTVFLKVNVGGEIQLRDSLAIGPLAGPIIWRSQLQPVSNQEQLYDHSYKSPPFFSTGVVLAFTGAQLLSTATVNIDGYEEAA